MQDYESGTNESIDMLFIKRVMQINNRHIEHIPKNTRFFLRNERYGALSILLTGSIKTEINGENGKIIRLRTMNAPDILAPLVLFSDRNILPFDVVALEDCTVLKIRKETLFQEFFADSELMDYFLRIISNRSLYLFEKIQFLNFSTISSKIAYYLLSIANEKDNIVTLTMSIQELSEYFGVERPSLSKVLGELSEKGIIKKLSRSDFQIIDKNKLYELLIGHL